MNFSLSKPQVKSGDVHSGTLLCEYLAVTLSNSSHTFFNAGYKTCCLALGNNSKHHLTNVKCYMKSGWNDQLPQVITPNCTGLFASAGLRYGGTGSAGVATFEIPDGPPNQRCLQIMWSIPGMHNIYDLWVNVAMGAEEASLELFSKLYRGSGADGHMPVKAVDTPCHFSLDSFDAIVVMSNHLQSILTVHFEDAPVSGGPHDRMKTFMDLHYRTTLSTPDAVKIV